MPMRSRKLASSVGSGLWVRLRAKRPGVNCTDHILCVNSAISPPSLEQQTILITHKLSYDTTQRQSTSTQARTREDTAAGTGNQR